MKQVESEDVLRIKFYGEALSEKSVPIYELASSLIAVQRIVHKSALYSEDRLRKGVLLPPRRRESLALQITTHQKSSDLWGFAPYLIDPATGPIIQGLIILGIGAVGAYVGRKIASGKEDPPDQKLVVNIYPEVKQIADRINNVGGIEKIEFRQPLEPVEKVITIDADTQEYVRRLEHELVPGNRMIISGAVTRIMPQSLRLDLQDAPGHYIHVKMDFDLFERVRRLPTLTEREIRFEGTPMYRVGDSGSGITEFQADRLIIPRLRF